MKRFDIAFRRGNEPTLVAYFYRTEREVLIACDLSPERTQQMYKLNELERMEFTDGCSGLTFSIDRVE